MPEAILDRYPVVQNMPTETKRGGEGEGEVDALTKIVYNYMRLHHTLEKSDCIFVLGCHDLRVAERAAELYLAGYAPLLIFSGGFGNLTTGYFPKPEAEMFADVALRMGVPKENIIIENKSTNTGENLRFTYKILQEKNIHAKSMILVQKPYMERRVYATFKKQWPVADVRIVVTSPKIPYEEYFDGTVVKDEVINHILGDFQRIKVYPEKGFQIYQEIPNNVWQAFTRLVELGYNTHLIKN